MNTKKTELLGTKKKILSFGDVDLWEIRIVDLKFKGSKSKERHVGYSLKNNPEDKMIHITNSEYKEEDIALMDIITGEYISVEEIKQIVKLGTNSQCNLPRISEDVIDNIYELYDDFDVVKFYNEFLAPINKLWESYEVEHECRGYIEL